MSDKNSELVLCVRRSDVDDLFAVHARRPWYPATEEEVDAWLAKATKAFLPRSIAETSREWVHFCTYAVLTSGLRVFSYRRGKSGSEDRLHGLLSIGVGGHVGIDDYDSSLGVDAHMLARAALRELDEEISRFTPTGAGLIDMRLAALIADDSSPVNAVHIGAAYQMQVDHKHIRAREDCLADPQWLAVEELHARRDQFERWSKICVEHLAGKAVAK